MSRFPQKLSVIFLTRALPYPPIGGVPLRNWQNIHAVAQVASVVLFSIFPGNAATDNIPIVADWYHSPLQRTLATRIRNRLPWLSWVRPQGHPYTDTLYTRSAAQQLEQVLQTYRPQVVVVEEVWLYRYLPLLKRYGCRVVLDAHNVEADREKYTNAVLGKTEGLAHTIQLQQIARIERSFIHQADQVWLCSEADRQLVRDLYSCQTTTVVIPNSIDVQQYNESLSLEQVTQSGYQPAPHDLLFMGVFGYPPNQAAAHLLIHQIYPRLKQRYPDVRLVLMGSGATQEMRQAAQQDADIIVTGRVPDVRPYTTGASVMVVPLLQGGGTRLKILEAFAAHCPVVSTHKGAEGLAVQDGEHLLLRDTSEDLVDAVSQVWSKPELRASLATAAYDLVKAEYSWESTAQKVHQALEILM